jgi:hypothetical protein
MNGAYITNMKYQKCVQNLVGKMKGKHNFQDLNVDGRAVLKHILKECGGTHLVSLRIESR